MHSINDFMESDHRHCDDLFAEVELAVAAQAWDRATDAFTRFQSAMQAHFAAEEEILFPAFVEKSGIVGGPTQVMQEEHVQMNALLAQAKTAILEREAEEYGGHAETLLIMMQQHNMKEEHVLYPMCDEHLRDQVDSMLLSLQSKVQ